MSSQKRKRRGVFDDLEGATEEDLKKLEIAYEFLENNPGKRKKSKSFVKELILDEKEVEIDEELISTAIRKFERDYYSDRLEKKNEREREQKRSYDKLEKFKKDVEKLEKGELSPDDLKKRIDQLEHDPEDSYYRTELPEPYEQGDPNNILIIGDTHEPFSLDGYLEHCRETQERFNCGTVVHIGDVIDNHYSSYHETEPDGFGAGCELDRAIARVKDWGYVFPEVKVCIGNHDRLVHRKARTANLSQRWIRDFNEVLQVPNWEFGEYHEIGDILFEHGAGRSGVKAALNKAMNKRISTVQGHIHTEASVMYNESPKDRLFGMQVGCGIDEESYALAYAKDFPKCFNISCGVILNGELPIVVPMDRGKD